MTGRGACESNAATRTGLLVGASGLQVEMHSGCCSLVSASLDVTSGASLGWLGIHAGADRARCGRSVHDSLQKTNAITEKCAESHSGSTNKSADPACCLKGSQRFSRCCAVQLSTCMAESYNSKWTAEISRSLWKEMPLGVWL